MKKKHIYLLTIGLFIITASFIVGKYSADKKKKEATTYYILDRTGPAAESEEWALTSKRATELYKKIVSDPDDAKSKLALASMYVQEARITGNYMYYDKAAMKYIDDVLKKDTANFEATTLKAMLQLSQHHFAEGLLLAEKAKNGNPYNAFIYGILIDGNVEMGNYDSAVANADKMISLRPDIRSYSRISYLREIYGDYPGAIEAMKMAVEAGFTGDENTEWSRVQLGKLYEHTGDLVNAEFQYKVSLRERPGYAYALAGLARIATINKDYPKAIAFYMQADSLINDFSFKEEMADIYYRTGETKKADAIMKNILDVMSKTAQEGLQDESIGHYADLELARAYLKVKNYDKALYHTLQEYNRRPGNIDVNEMLGWVYYLKGDAAKAMPFIKIAMQTNSMNPVLLCRAGLVYVKNGDNNKGRELLQLGLKNNTLMSASLRDESSKVLQTL